MTFGQRTTLGPLANGGYTSLRTGLRFVCFGKWLVPTKSLHRFSISVYRFNRFIGIWQQESTVQPMYCVPHPSYPLPLSF